MPLRKRWVDDFCWTASAAPATDGSFPREATRGRPVVPDPAIGLAAIPPLLAANHPRCDRCAQPARSKPAALGDELAIAEAQLWKLGLLAQLDASLGLFFREVHRRQLQWAAARGCTWTRLASRSGARGGIGSAGVDVSWSLPRLPRL